MGHGDDERRQLPALGFAQALLLRGHQIGAARAPVGDGVEDLLRREVGAATKRDRAAVAVVAVTVGASLAEEGLSTLDRVR